MYAKVKRRLFALGLGAAVLCQGATASSSAAADAVYGSEWDYVWLIAVLFLVFIFVMKKLFQVNAKNAQYRARLDPKKNKK